MQTLVRAMVATPEAGEPLPSPFKQWEEMKIYHRRGQLSLVAAASGGAKSTYAVHLAVHSNPPIPTVYCSADTDVNTLGIRVAASVRNRPMSEIEDLVRDQDPDILRDVEDRTDHVLFYWKTTPGLQDIQDEVEAYAIENGEWPWLIVVDNLINVDPEGEAGYLQKDAVLAWLATLAEYTNAHVLVLHHVTKEHVNGDKPIPKSALLDSVDKRPRLILTMYRMDENHIGVGVVKNSNGQANPDGTWGPTLGVMLDRMWMAG